MIRLPGNQRTRRVWITRFLHVASNTWNAGGTRVLALPGGTAAETISDGVSGYVCQLLDEMADYARGGQTLIRPSAVRRYVEQHFAAEHMASEYVQLYSQIYENASAKRGKGTQGSGGLTTTA